MRLRTLWLTDFRNYEAAELHFSDGVTAITGANGQGKSNVIEAIGYLATMESFRGSPLEAMVRVGASQAVIRADIERDERDLLVEAEINARGRSRLLINKQRLARNRDLLGALRVTVFAPDDLRVVKGAPAERRQLLDNALAMLHAKHHVLHNDVERVLRQRAALLKQSAGRLTDDIAFSLDVWDARLAELGGALTLARRELIARLEPAVAKAYESVSSVPAAVALTYLPSWSGDSLAQALARARGDDVRRGITTIGPHRDDLSIGLGGLPARTHASQGEQRCLALALRLATHEIVSEQTQSAPVLLLDDVFSELDGERAEALLRALPAGQTVLTTAAGLPPAARPDAVFSVHEGRVR